MRCSCPHTEWSFARVELHLQHTLLHGLDVADQLQERLDLHVQLRGLLLGQSLGLDEGLFLEEGGERLTQGCRGDYGRTGYAVSSMDKERKKLKNYEWLNKRMNKKNGQLWNERGGEGWMNKC